MLTGRERSNYSLSSQSNDRNGDSILVGKCKYELESTNFHPLLAMFSEQ